MEINEHTISHEEQFSIHLDDQFKWLNFEEVNKHIMLDADVIVPTVEQYENEADMGLHKDEFNPANDVDGAWDVGLDDYELAYDSGAESDSDTSDGVIIACNKYEQNSGGIVFSIDGKKIILKLGHLYKDIDEFRAIVKAFAI